MPNETTITVDVDDRGRFYIREPARRALSITDRTPPVRLRIWALDPKETGPVETGPDDDPRPDERGRTTIPQKYRSKLTIDGTDSICKIRVTVLENGPEYRH